MSDQSYPSLICNLPEADLPIDNVVGHLFQGTQGQICFFDFEAGTEVPAHSHGDQWGIVIEGALNLTIEDKPRTLRKGDSYYIPAGVVHSASCDQPCKVLDFFQDSNRYRPKSSWTQITNCGSDGTAFRSKA